MSMRGHRRHKCPALLFRIVAFDEIQRFQTVAPSHHKQHVVNHGHTELQPTAVHVADLGPRVCAEVVALDTGGTCL